MFTDDPRGAIPGHCEDRSAHHNTIYRINTLVIPLPIGDKDRSSWAIEKLEIRNALHAKYVTLHITYAYNSYIYIDAIFGHAYYTNANRVVAYINIIFYLIVIKLSIRILQEHYIFNKSSIKLYQIK